jgi:murein DD-endopeptidase MepM/ murein hydrolase activator NlpD
MRARARVFRGNSKLSLFVTGAAAVLLSACSSDVERFADNPTEGNDSIYTSSVPKSVQTDTASSEDTSVSSRPLASAVIKPKPNYASNGYNYQQSYPRQPIYRQPQFKAEARPSATIQVGQGMTLYSIARTNHVSVGELASANGIRPPYGVHVGQTLRIPGAMTAMASEPRTAAAPEPRLAEAQPAYAKPEQEISSSGGVHTVKAGETLFSLGRTYGVHPYRIADLNHLSHNVSLSVGQAVRIPNGGTAKTAVIKPKGQERIVASNEPENQPAVTKVQKPAPQTEQAAAPEPQTQQAKPQQPQQQASAAPEPQPAQDQGGLAFRWPVKGRVISDYGSKPNGLRNEGINISVPEGTSIRAAEGGIVAYAGNELKGYGNLVLIRHDGGWVTAYAHNKELFVKRGDAVKRGDIIAKAGQTGSVTSPQLHFEVRKGATAVDPMRFLNSATAEN